LPCAPQSPWFVHPFLIVFIVCAKNITKNKSNLISSYVLNAQYLTKPNRQQFLLYSDW
jgi:hypothetical protein